MTPARLLAFALALGFGASACEAPVAPVSPKPQLVRAGSAAASPKPLTWSTRLNVDHPLVGRLWSVGKASFVDEAEVLSALHGYVLLGEKHDNPDHHALQARLLGAMLAAGLRPVVAFEMFDVDNQEAIELSRRDHPRDAASLARAVDWEKSGWPPWVDYAPIAQIALDAELKIVATGLPRARLRALMTPAKDGSSEAAPLDMGAPLTSADEQSLRDELRASHCGHLPEAQFDAMIRFQRARDASMANALVAATAAAKADDAVLIAGTGHAREDRGAGRDLALLDVTRRVTSVAFVEVAAGEDDPAGYAARWNTTRMPFDFVWFTPRANDDDPCAAFAH